MTEIYHGRQVLGGELNRSRECQEPGVGGEEKEATAQDSPKAAAAGTSEPKGTSAPTTPGSRQRSGLCCGCLSLELVTALGTLDLVLHRPHSCCTRRGRIPPLHARLPCSLQKQDQWLHVAQHQLSLGTPSLTSHLQG